MNTSFLKLITLNVETNKHWNRIIPFLEHEEPDIICLQEIFENDLLMLKERFGYFTLQVPMTKKMYIPGDEASLVKEGPAIASRFPFSEEHTSYYYKPSNKIQIFEGSSEEIKRETIHQGLVWGTVQKETTPYTIATTHFTWTRNGLPNANQEKDMGALMGILNNIPELIVCGDFNIPRGYNSLYKTLTARFKDNIPETITSTIDMDIHRAAKDLLRRSALQKYVVDYIFSTPAYTVQNVEVKSGLSDHCAIIANISKSL